MLPTANSSWIRLIEPSTFLFKQCQDLIEQINQGLFYYKPELIEEGEGGAYFLRNQYGDILAVFKPSDEEPFSDSNPKFLDHGGDGNNQVLKRGIKPGEAAIREVAAYILDRGFASVPLTVLVELCIPEDEVENNNNNNRRNSFSNKNKTFSSFLNKKQQQQQQQQPSYRKKVGSLQQYVSHHYESWDLGPQQYPVKDVHHIGVLDLRIFNVDRHGGNILVERQDIVDHGAYKLHPIDHGFSLPSTVEATDLWFEWLLWPQSKVPFDEETLTFIRSLNVVNDAKILEKLGFREDCIKTMMISTTFLKRAAQKGLTLHQIGQLICRKSDYGKKKVRENQSALEQIAMRVPLSFNSKYFLTWLETEVDKILDFNLSSSSSSSSSSSVGITNKSNENSSTPTASPSNASTHKGISRHKSSVSFSLTSHTFFSPQKLLQSSVPFPTLSPANNNNNSSLTRSTTTTPTTTTTSMRRSPSGAKLCQSDELPNLMMKRSHSTHCFLSSQFTPCDALYA